MANAFTDLFCAYSKFSVKLSQGWQNRGGRGTPHAPEILVDKLTLSQREGADYADHMDGAASASFQTTLLTGK